MAHSIIQKSQLEWAHRLDAEYFQPEYLEIVNNLLKIKNFTLGNISQRVTQGPNPIFIESGECCLNGRNIKNFRVDPEESNYVSKQEFEKYRNFKVKKDDILITLKGLGSIGKTGYVFKELGCIFSRDVGLIRLSDELLSKFIYAFLLSKYGSSQVVRAISGGTGQLTLATSALKQIIIPEFQTKVISEIAKLISESEENYESSKNTYQQAENLLLEELKLKDFQPDYDLSFVVNLSDVKSANRVDAEYFQPKYKKLIDQIKSHNAKMLGDLVSMKKGFEPGSEAYQEEGELFIRVSSLSKFGIDAKDQKYLSKDLYESLKKDFEPQASEVLLTKDATPGIAYVVKEPIEGVISGGILRLKVKTDLDQEYLALCINSIIGKWQAERDAGGSVIAHWKPEQIKNLLIPVIPKPTQQKIAELVRKSHEARKKSKQLLEEAKRKVEEMIEKGGSSS